MYSIIHKQLLWCEKNRKLIIAFVFILFLCIGLAVYGDYGISVDELGNRAIGIVSFNYIVHGDRYLFRFVDRDHGVAFHLPLVIVEKVLGLKDFRDIFLMRHLVTFLAFYTGVVTFYFLCKKIFTNWKYGLIGSLFLIISPRIFAESFYNSKDLVFLSAFIIGIYTLILFLHRKTIFFAALHGIVSAIGIDIRILGILIPFFTFCSFLIDTTTIKTSLLKKIQSFFSYIFLYGFICIVCTILFWPWLWEDPLMRFIQAFANMSKFRWEGPVLYFGQHIPSTNLPWHYIPTWLMITTPVAYTFLFIVGLFCLGKDMLVLLKNRRWDKHIHQLVICAWFFIPLCIIILLRSVVYDGWRHLYFIYPAFLLIALTGLSYLWQTPWNILTYIGKIFRALIISFISLNLIATLFFMISCHPFQNVYFNMLAGRDGESIQKKFELDYWGLSYKQGIEYIARTDMRQEIKVFFFHGLA